MAEEDSANDIFRKDFDEHENEGWMFLCRKCQQHYSTDGLTDRCPVCDWSDGNVEPPANWL